MRIVVCTNNRMIWIFTTLYKRAHLRTILFIRTTLKNKHHPCKRVIFDEDGALSKSTDVTNLLVDDFSIYMETTGDGASWLNGNNERHNRIIHTIVIAGLIDSKQHLKMVLYRKIISISIKMQDT